MDITEKLSEYFDIEQENIIDENTFDELGISPIELEDFLLDCLGLDEDIVEKIVDKYNKITIEDLSKYL